MSDLFDFKAPANHYAVMGNPIAHSKSPQIHQAFALQCDISIEYDRIQVDSGGFAQAVSHFAAHNGAGLNITLPYKIEAWQMCRQPNNTLSPRALLAESVNTLQFNHTNDTIFGDNTDGIGIVRDIENNVGYTLHQKRILMIGAGGAARGVCGPILDTKPTNLTIVNRTPSKATTLATRLHDAGFHSAQSLKLVDLENTLPYDIIINATAASIESKLPNIPAHCITENTLAYDMMYSRAPTIFMQWALTHGAAKASDGIGMLVEQAAKSFQIWHNQMPETKPVIAALRQGV